MFVLGLVDQVADLDRQGADLSRRLAMLHEEALQAVADLETRHKEALENLREGFALQMEEMQRVVDIQYRQYTLGQLMVYIYRL